MRRLVEDGRPRAGRRPRRAARRGPPAAGQEALEDEPGRRRGPLTTRRTTSAAGPGHRGHLVAGIDGGPTNRPPGSEIAGVPGVGDERDVVALAEHLEHLGGPRRLGVLVGHGQAGAADPGVLQEAAGAAGVLAADEGGVAERLDRPRRQVAEVADRASRRGPAGRRRPSDRTPAHGRRPASPSRSSTSSPIDRAQRSNTPAWASITHAASGRGGPMRCRAMRTALIDGAVGDPRTRRRGGSACRSCAPGGHGYSTNAPSGYAGGSAHVGGSASRRAPPRPRPGRPRRSPAGRSREDGRGTGTPTREMPRIGTQERPAARLRGQGAPYMGGTTSDRPPRPSGGSSGWKRARREGAPEGGPEVPDDRGRVHRRLQRPPARRRGPRRLRPRRSRARHDQLDRHQRGGGHARRDRRVHRRRPRARAGAVGLQPGRRPHAAGLRQGCAGSASRSRPSSPRRTSRRRTPPKP